MVEPTRCLLMTSELFAPGGIQHVGREAIAALSARGALSVWTLRDASVPPAFQAPAATIRCAGGARSRLLAWALQRAAHSCRGLAVVVMHAHLAPAALPLQLRGARVTVMLHGVEVWRPLNAVEHAALMRADRLIANSQYTIERFRSVNHGFRAVPVDVCPLGVAPAAPAAPEPTESDTVLMVSRLSSEDRYKGHDALLHAWRLVRRAVPRARLVLVGDGDDRLRLEALARSLDVADTVQFVGRTSAEDLERWYRRCAFSVLPSTEEGFGLVLLEAMRAGRTCVACTGAAEEIIEPEVTGLLVPDQQPETLAAAIVRLYSDTQLREQLGRQAYQRWSDVFTAERFAERFRALILRAAEQAA